MNRLELQLKQITQMLAIARTDHDKKQLTQQRDKILKELQNKEDIPAPPDQ